MKHYKENKKMKLKRGHILVLRNCTKNMTSYNGFIWPKKGEVTAQDWQNDDACGSGLHGIPWGAGGNYWIGDNWRKESKWLVVDVSTHKSNYRHGSGDLTDKCKFKTGVVLKVFDCPYKAVAFMFSYMPNYAKCKCWFIQSTSGDSGQSTSGNSGQSTSGYSGQSTSGDYGHAYTLNGGKAKAGKGGVVVLSRWMSDHWECRVGHVGREVEADKFYTLNEKLEIVEVDDEVRK